MFNWFKAFFKRLFARRTPAKPVIQILEISNPFAATGIPQEPVSSRKYRRQGGGISRLIILARQRRERTRRRHEIHASQVRNRV